VVVVAEDVKTVSERRRVTPPGGVTPSQYPSSSSNGSPPHGSLPLEGSAPFGAIERVGTLVPFVDDGRACACARLDYGGIDVFAPFVGDGQAVPVHNSTAEGSTTKHYPAVVQKIAGLTLIAGVATAYAIFSAFHDNNKDG
jgi:hypothetical protein